MFNCTKPHMYIMVGLSGPYTNALEIHFKPYEVDFNVINWSRNVVYFSQTLW